MKPRESRVPRNIQLAVKHTSDDEDMEPNNQKKRATLRVN